MFTKKQVKVIIDVLKSKELATRPALQCVFEAGGFMWATDGYIALELGEVADNLKNKCITLNELIKWNATHKSKDETSLIDLVEDNYTRMPQMTKLLHIDYGKPDNVTLNVNLLKLASDFLGVKNVELKRSGNIFLVTPALPDEQDIMHRAMEIKAYIMGLRKD